MKRTILLAGFFFMGAMHAQAADLWYEHFDGGTPGVQPLGWYDETNDSGFNAEIAYNVTNSLADVTVAGSAGWGKVTSFSQDVNLSLYDKVEVVITALNGCTVRVGIFHPGPTPPYQFWDLVTGASISTPGTYTFDIPSKTGESGTQFYGIQLSVEGPNGAYATFHSVRIYGGGHHADLHADYLTHLYTHLYRDAHIHGQSKLSDHYADTIPHAHHNPHVHRNADPYR
jgi:hypothetical protein